jgi:hypothetical protein
MVNEERRVLGGRGMLGKRRVSGKRRVFGERRVLGGRKESVGRDRRLVTLTHSCEMIKMMSKNDYSRDFVPLPEKRGGKTGRMI